MHYHRLPFLHKPPPPPPPPPPPSVNEIARARQLVSDMLDHVMLGDWPDPADESVTAVWRRAVAFVKDQP